MFTEKSVGCSKALHEVQLSIAMSTLKITGRRVNPELTGGLNTQIMACFSQ
jgi:hypothetical protein